MFCPKCGKPIPENSAFCMFCGNSIPQGFHQEPIIEPAPEIPSEPFAEPSPEPLESPFYNAEPPSPFYGTEPSDSPFYDAPPAQPETFEPGRAFSEKPSDSSAPYIKIRHCSLCGRELPASNQTGICVTCTNNRSFTPEPLTDNFQLDLDLDAEYPEAYRDKPQKIEKQRESITQKRRFPLLIALAAVLLAGALACFAVASLMKKPSGSSSSSQGTSAVTSAQEKEVASYAQSMVKSKAANPSSVHFQARSLSVSEKDGLWTVQQSFERMAPTGEMTESTYTALLQLDENAADGYRPLMLQVDGSTLYDYR